MTANMNRMNCYVTLYCFSNNFTAAQNYTNVSIYTLPKMFLLAFSLQILKRPEGVEGRPISQF